MIQFSYRMNTKYYIAYDMGTKYYISYNMVTKYCIASIVTKYYIDLW